MSRAKQAKVEDLGWKSHYCKSIIGFNLTLYHAARNCEILNVDRKNRGKLENLASKSSDYRLRNSFVLLDWYGT